MFWSLHTACVYMTINSLLSGKKLARTYASVSQYFDPKKVFFSLLFFFFFFISKGVFFKWRVSDRLSRSQFTSSRLCLVIQGDDPIHTLLTFEAPQPLCLTQQTCSVESGFLWNKSRGLGAMIIKDLIEILWKTKSLLWSMSISPNYNNCSVIMISYWVSLNQPLSADR